MNATHAATLALVVLLCAPAVAGTLVLCAVGADVFSDRAAGLLGRWSVELFVMAAYGPLLVGVASVPAIFLSRRANSRTAIYAAWTAVFAGLLAAAGFWLYGIHTVPTP